MSSPAEDQVLSLPTVPVTSGQADSHSSSSDSHSDKVSDDKVEPTEGAATPYVNEKKHVDVSEETGSLSSDHIITDGNDVSNVLISVRDDGDASWTFRSVVLSLLAASFDATMTIIYRFKPTQVELSSTFLALIIWVAGLAWAKLLPTRHSLEKRHGQGKLSPRLLAFVHFINPGPFGLKEHVVATMAASSAATASAAVDIFTTQKLFYTNKVTATTAVLSSISIGLFGYGLAGLARPILVYPSQMVYWGQLPTIDLFQSLHWGDVSENKKRVKIFWYSLTGLGLFEFFPAYIWPWLNSISIPCLAAMKATGNTAKTLTNIFGGAQSNEGLGLFSISLDWQYITSSQLSLPLKQQGNSWIGIGICYIVMTVIYYTNTWNSKTYPFMSTSLFSTDGTKYPQNKVFVNGILDKSKLEAYGYPQVAGTYAWGMLARNLAVGGLIAHVILFWGKDVVAAIKQSRSKTQKDRHWVAMQKYKEAPWWWYTFCLVLSFVLGLVVALKENTTLTAGSYIISLVVGTIIAPFSGVLYAILGNGISTNQLVKMIAGVVAPGRPLANLYFYGWSHQIIAQVINFSGDLKLGQYLKIPPRSMFLTQVIGTIYGAAISYVVMTSIVSEKFDLLQDQNGSFAWSGAYFQSLNASAVTWALAKWTYGPSSPYFIIPISVFVGMGVVAVHWVFTRFVPRVGKFDTTDLVLPTVFLYSAWMTSGQNCVMLSTILVGIISQCVVRKRYPRTFKKYNYLVGAGFDGGALIVMFILSFAVFGAAGKQKPFPTWWGNSDGYQDLCPDSSS